MAYWMKCTQLGYLQSAPQEGLATRPRALTTEKLLEQCGYIFGPKLPLIDEDKVARMNGFLYGTRRASQSGPSSCLTTLTSSSSLQSLTRDILPRPWFVHAAETCPERVL